MGFVRKNAAPASAAALRAHVEERRAALAANLAEEADLNEDLPNHVGDPESYREARARLNLLGGLIREDRDTIALIEPKIAEAEERERRERFQAELDERVRQSDRIKRGLEARYTKAAEAFAEVCREIQGDADAWRAIRAGADCFTPRVPVPTLATAEASLRHEKFAKSNGLKGLTEDLTVRAWDGSTLFRS